MNNTARRPRWTNPYIEKVAALDQTIFTCSREQPEALAPKIAPLLQSFPRLILELCSGSGAHLIALAKGNPDALCIGVELRYKRLVRTAEKAESLGLENLRLLQLDAAKIAHVLPPKSCNHIYINFPDPWDGKTHWEQKYLLSAELMKSLAQISCDTGYFHYKTDHLKRFHQVHKVVRDLAELWKIDRYSEDLHSSEYSSGNILTEFEHLFRSQKLSVNYLRAKRLA